MKILNSCRRSNLLTSDLFSGMCFPRAIQRFLSSFPEEEAVTSEDYSTIGDLKEWLRVTLGGSSVSLLLLCWLVSLTSSLRSVSCDLLLDMLHSLMKKNKYGYSTLILLRSDSDLCCDDLTDGALNVYVAQVIIESLKSERWVKSDPGPPPPAPSPLSTQPIMISVAIDNSKQDRAMGGMAEQVASIASNVKEIREGVKEVGESVREVGEGVKEVGEEVVIEVKFEKQDR